MAYYYDEPSRTFNEYLLVPGHTPATCIPASVSLKTPLVKYRKGEEECPLSLNIPMVSAIMAAVSDDNMAVALATEGGLSFIYGNQTIEQEAAMVKRVKDYKAGFVESDANLSPDMTLNEVVALKEATDHSTMPVTDDGTAHCKLLGVVTERDYRLSRMSGDEKVSEFMTPREKLIVAPADTSLKVANDIIWDHKLNSLPLVNDDDTLAYMVFRKDYDSHKSNPNEMLDAHKRYMVGAGINSRDYAERVPALVEAGADVLCIDSSEGYSDWQKMTIEWVREHYGDSVKIGAGNVVDGEGFRFLAEAGADFVKTASAAAPSASRARPRASAAARLRLPSRLQRLATNTSRRPASTCPSAPTAASSTITTSRWLWRWVLTSLCSAATSRAFDESLVGQGHGERHLYEGVLGEGSARARNWGRYDLGGKKSLSFEEGVDSYAPYAGSPLKDNIAVTLLSIKSTMCNGRCAHHSRVPGQGCLRRSAPRPSSRAARTTSF